MTAPEINERSYGVVPLMILQGVPHILIVQHHSGAWLFPKGHAEGEETARQAAERELSEETGLDVERWLDHEPFVERYSFWREDKRIHKEAQYFPALVKGKLRLQSEEIKASRWEPAHSTPAAVSFPEMKQIAEQVVQWLSGVTWS